MILHKTPRKDARVIERERRGDDRGFFGRMFCEKEFGAVGAGLELWFCGHSLGEKNSSKAAWRIRQDARDRQALSSIILKRNEYLFPRGSRGPAAPAVAEVPTIWRVCRNS